MKIREEQEAKKKQGQIPRKDSSKQQDEYEPFDYEDEGESSLDKRSMRAYADSERLSGKQGSGGIWAWLSPLLQGVTLLTVLGVAWSAGKSLGEIQTTLNQHTDLLKALDEDMSNRESGILVRLARIEVSLKVLETKLNSPPTRSGSSSVLRSTTSLSVSSESSTPLVVEAAEKLALIELDLGTLRKTVAEISPQKFRNGPEEQINDLLVRVDKLKNLLS